MNWLAMPWIRPAANAIFLLMAFWVGHEWRDRAADAEVAQLKASFEVERADAATAQTAAVERARADERRTQHRIQEVLDAEHIQRQALAAARARADARARGLHDQLAVTRAAFAALVAHDSAASQECRAAAAAGAVCTELLGRCSDRRRELAQFAEDSNLAGQTCVGAYRALTIAAPPRLGQGQ